MNMLTEKGFVREMPCGADFAYILQDNCPFLSTEYKVLQSQSGNSFLKCMKLLYNGKVQLYYLADQYKPLAALLPTLDSESFMIICANMLAVILDVKNNGFLSCRSIEISPERVYVDPTTYKVSLVYLPVGQRLFDDNMTFENELRTGWVRTIQTYSHLTSPKTDRFSKNLSNGSVSLEALYTSIKTGAAPEITTPQPPAQPASRIKLVSMDAPSRVVLSVNKPEYTIGKKAGSVDGVLSFNNAISRVHCKINAAGTGYTITDLGSANGTYVNKQRLNPNMPHPIKAGDVVRLANSNFQVVAE